MTALSMTMLSPTPVYRDESAAGSKLAPRPSTLEGKVLGLLPNWRPSAVHILEALGALVGERFRLKNIVMEQRVLQVPITEGKLIDSVREKLDDLARRADVVITASGD
ncbi:MAG: hypothetical protein HY323_17245 [Betaproteobacteria bacterium]|nr:hypothetical protein [Betaproteobacteria bacterium]